MVECTQTIPLPWGGREVVYKRLSVKVHQTQVKGKKTRNDTKSQAIQDCPTKIYYLYFLVILSCL